VFLLSFTKTFIFELVEVTNSGLWKLDFGKQINENYSNQVFSALAGK